MLREVVDSASLRSIGYDPSSQTLEVEFSSGSIYRYALVPGDVWTGLKRAESKGKYFQDFVRDHFEVERVS